MYLTDKAARSASSAAPTVLLMVDSQLRPLTDKIRRGDQAGFERPHQVPHQHATCMATIQAAMRIRQDGRHHLRPRGASQSLGAPPPGANGAPGAPARPPRSGRHLQQPADFPSGRRRRASDSDSEAHTDGDTLVYFPNNNVIMIGDYFRSLGYPNIDRANGGSLPGMLAGIDKAISLCKCHRRRCPRPWHDHGSQWTHRTSRHDHCN